MSVRTKGPDKKLAIEFRLTLPGGRTVHASHTFDLVDNKKNRKYVEDIDKIIHLEKKRGTFDYLRHFPNGKHAQSFRKQVAEITFAEVYDKWIGLKDDLKQSTYDVYQSTYNSHFKERFGGHPISSITEDDIIAFRIELRELKRLKANTINDKPMKMMKMIMNFAHKRGYIKNNPCIDIRPLKTQIVDIDPLSFDELNQLLETLKKKGKDDWYDLFQFWSRTGLRPGELYALKWEHVDFFNKKLMVRSTRYKGKDGLPKTRHSNRDIDLNEAAIAALQRQKARTGLQDSYIFLTHAGKPYSDAFMRKKFRHIFMLCGLKCRPPKQMRHTFASLNLGAQESISWVSKMLGHASAYTTYTRYNRYIPNLTHRDGTKFEEMMDMKAGSAAPNVVKMSS